MVLNIYFCLPKIFFFLLEKKNPALPGDCNPLEALFVLYNVVIMQNMLGFRGRKKMHFVKLNKKRICSFWVFFFSKRNISKAQVDEYLVKLLQSCFPF